MAHKCIIKFNDTLTQEDVVVVCELDVITAESVGAAITTFLGEQDTDDDFITNTAWVGNNACNPKNEATVHTFMYTWAGGDYGQYDVIFYGTVYIDRGMKELL